MMDTPSGKFQISNPIVASAALVGGLSFLIGFIGPAVFSDSNLGPMLGIFVTGPLGLLLGTLIGILISVRRKAPQPATTELRWLSGAWLGALLFTLASSIAGIGWLSLGAQLVVVTCAAMLFYLMPSQLPEAVRKSRPIILLGGVMVLAASIFPPVNSGTAGHPPFAIFLDDRFDASTRVPEYTVHQAKLMLAWLVIATAVTFVVIVRRRSRGSRHS